MMLSQAMSGHGTFIYVAESTIKRFGGAQKAAQAIRACGMQHAWVRIHGMSRVHTDKATGDLIKALQEEGVAVAGWGWCQGADIANDVSLAIKGLQRYELTDYVADIEDGVSEAKWHVAKIEEFFKKLKSHEDAPKAVAVSSFALISLHKPELMLAAEPYVDLFAPQIYWFNYPTTKLLKNIKAKPEDYELNNAASYARLSIADWRKTIKTKPLLATGQAYFSKSEAPNFDADAASEKVGQFISEFNEWQRLAGLNWWFFSANSSGAMSDKIYKQIAAAQLNNRFD